MEVMRGGRIKEEKGEQKVQELNIVETDGEHDLDDGMSNDDFDSKFTDNQDCQEDVGGAPASDARPHSAHDDDSSYRTTKPKSLVDIDDENTHDGDVLREISHEGA